MNTRDRRHTRWLFCYAGMPNADKSLYIVIKKIPFAPEDATDFPTVSHEALCAFELLLDLLF